MQERALAWADGMARFDGTGGSDSGGEGNTDLKIGWTHEEIGRRVGAA